MSPQKRDPRNIKEFEDEVLTDRDILQAIAASTSLTRDWLKSKLEEFSLRILEEAAVQIKEFTNADRKFDGIEKEFNRNLKGRLWKKRVRRILVLLLWAAGVLLVLAFGGSLFLFFTPIGKGIQPAIWGWLTSPPRIFGDFNVLHAIYISIFIIALVVYFLRYRGRDDAEAEKQLKTELDFESAKLTRDSTRNVADQTVLATAIQYARASIYKKPFFQDRLYLYRPEVSRPSAPAIETISSGLAEVVNPLNVVSTKKREETLDLLKNLPGASIGIAGPRGVGKSTLLANLCAQEQIGGKAAVSALVSVPVEYEPREFLLHLFFALCAQVLKKMGLEEDDFPGPEEKARIPMVRNRLRIAAVLLVLGFFLVAGAVAFAILMSQLTRASVVAQPTATSAAQTNAAVSQPSPAPHWVQNLELKPGILLHTGLLIMLVGVALLVLSPQMMNSQTANKPSKPRRLSDYEKVLVDKCLKHVHNIRFQQSYSSGWSGALKLPIGLEGGINNTISMAQKQESFPEVVDKFKNFVMLISTMYPRVVIGIDEIDKLPTEEKAENFLNNVKAIFNIPSCYYLSRNWWWKLLSGNELGIA